MSSTRSVRPATAGDVPSIRRVALAAWRAAYGELFDDDAIAAMVEDGYAEAVLSEMVELDEVGLFVATVDDEVVGYTSCGLVDPVGIGDLDIYVHPDHWGEGIGEALLERGRDHLAALGTDTIRDEVLAANEVGNRFYAKHFERVDQRIVTFGGRELPVNVYEANVSP